MAPVFHKVCLTCTFMSNSQARIQELEEDTEGLRRVARGPWSVVGQGGHEEKHPNP